METSLYRLEHPLEKRKEDALKILAKYPDRIPVIAESGSPTQLPNMDKSRFLAPKMMTIGQFIHTIRMKLTITAAQAIYIHINGAIPSTMVTFEECYANYKSEDGFLYLTYTTENTFGEA